MARPVPPAALLDKFAKDRIEPAPDLEAWIRGSFIRAGAPLENPDHKHLRQASIGCCWTNVANGKAMKRFAATAQIPSCQGDKWARARHDQQLRDWFGQVPTFLIIFDATICARVSDIAFCAIAEHELYHCSQRRGEFGEPLFSRATGLPLFAMRGHDVEEFTPIARRYGIEACAGDAVNFLEAALSKPLIGAAGVRPICGICGQ